MIRTSVATTAAVLALVVPAASSAAGPATYTDRTGDSATAPDIQRILVTDNGTTWGFEIDLGSVQDLADNSVVALALDTDRSASTGDSTGIDYAIFASAGGLAFDKWDGTTFSPFAHTSTNPALSAGRLMFTVTKADVGSPAAFDFYVVSVHGNDQDVAPDGNGVFTWPLPTVQRVLVAGAPVAHAGKLFTVTGVRAQMSDQSTVAPTSVTCALTLGGKALPKAAPVRVADPEDGKGKDDRAQADDRRRLDDRNADDRAQGALSPAGHAAASFRLVSSRCSGITFTSASTGMKFVSPFQRGTTCRCTWSVTPAPATRPTFQPRLNPSGFAAAASADIAPAASRCVSTTSASSSASNGTS